MENLFKIKLNYKKNYSYGAYFAGFDLFDSLYIENLSDLAFSALKIRVISSPNVLLTADASIDYLAPLGYRHLSCDFVKPDISHLISTKSIFDVCITVCIYSEEGKLLSSADFSCKILPYYYFSGTEDMIESAAFFVTPYQPELSQIEPSDSLTDPIDFSQQVYDRIKELRITYFPEDYSGKTALPVRLCEKVLKDKFANSFELSLLFASVLEKNNLSPVLLFGEKGRVYSGFSLKKEKKPIVEVFGKNEHNFDDYFLIDGNNLAYGSNLSFDTALFQAKNALKLSDERIILLNISAARAHRILPLPNRILDKGDYIFSEKYDEENKRDFSDYDLLWKSFSEDDRVKAILLGGALAAGGKKASIPFQPDLDMNQNKILSKVLSGDFTLIRAQTGVGVSTLFAKACAMKLKSHRNVLYITDEKYHPDNFEHITKQMFDQSFVWNLLKDANKTYEKDEIASSFPEQTEVFSDHSEMKKILERVDRYYSDLEGDKSIVSSFLMASERYDQLQDANDSIVFAPEQIGLLSDEKVQEWFSTVNDIVKSLNEIGTVSEHPLLLVRNKNFSYEYKSKIIRLFESFLRCIEGIVSLRDQVLPIFSSVGTLSSGTDISAFCDLYRLFCEFSAIPEGFFMHPESIETHFKKATSLIQAKEENDRIYQMVNVSFHESVLELDASGLYAKYLSLAGDKSFKSISQKHSILKSVKRFLKPNCDVENIEYILSRLSIYQKNCEFINREKTSVFSLLALSEVNEDASWKDLPVVSDLCYQCFTVFQSTFDLKNLFSFVGDFSKAKSYPGISEKVQLLKDHVDEFFGLKKDIERLVQNEIDFFYPISAEEDFFFLIYRKFTEVLSASDQLKNWCNWLSVKEKAIGIGLKNIVIAIENGKVEKDELKHSFLRAFFKAVCEYNYISHSDLIPEHFSVDEAKNEFKAQFSQILSKGKGELDSILSYARFEGLREVENSLFTPFDLIANKKVFSSIFPCVISTCKKAKEIFSDKRHFFDLILVESRNALSLEDMLWMFYAGKQVAFAGAPSYSKRSHNVGFDLTGSAFDYLWKVTDEKYSLSASYYSTPVLTGLKSAYYSNISSEIRYYSVPATSFAPASEIRIVPGSFGGEYPGANFYEAQIAVDEIVSFALSDENEKSVGVVTSTPEQKRLILRLLAQKLRHQEDLAQHFTDFNRFYITSLGETLYPCDKIIYSATYATDRSVPGSRIHYDYLDFGGEDPVKLLGNMLSSAKEEVLVLTSFTSDDILRSPTLLPVNAAFSYLFDALNAPQVNNTYRVIGQQDETAQIKHLRTELEQCGYQTLSGVQSGRYYIDLAVIDKNSKFVLGIISDQSVLRQQNNISAIEIGNENYYSKNGWNLYRMRSTEFFDSFESVLQSVLQILQKGSSERELL